MFRDNYLVGIYIAVYVYFYKICFVSEDHPFSVTIICDSMAKHVHSIRHTTMQCFRGANIRQIKTVIQNSEASFDFKE